MKKEKKKLNYKYYYQKVSEINKPKNAQEFAEQLKAIIFDLKNPDLFSELIKQPHNLCYIDDLLTLRKEYDRILKWYITNGVNSEFSGLDLRLFIDFDETLFGYMSEYSFGSVNGCIELINFLENCVEQLQNLCFESGFCNEISE